MKNLMTGYMGLNVREPDCVLQCCKQQPQNQGSLIIRFCYLLSGKIIVVLIIGLNKQNF